VLTYNAAVHADLLFSLPGMFSYNLWTGLPTPTHANVTHWFSLLDKPWQMSIVRELESHPRACVIVQREHVNFLAKRGLAPSGQLYDYIHREFEPAFTIDDVEFCVRRGRRIRPFLLAELLTRSETADGAAASTLLTFTILLAPKGPVSHIELSTAVGNGASLELNSSNARVELSRVDGRGEQSGPRIPAPWPVQVPGPCTIWIYYNGDTLPPPARGATIVLRNKKGEEVGLARLASPTMTTDADVQRGGG
jgi:hypothetical protein